MLPSGTWSRCWGLPGDWRMDESLNKGRVGKPGFRNIYPAKGSERADCTARHGALPSGPQPCRETSAAEGSENVGRSAEHQPDAPLGSQRGADWERRQVGSSDSRRGGRQRTVLPSVVDWLAQADQAESCHRERVFFEHLCGSPARMTAGIAEHQDVEGWPPRRQRRTWHDVQRNRGQNSKHHQEFKVPSILERHGADCADGFGGPQSDSRGSRRGDPTRPAPPGLPYCPDQHIRSWSGQDLRTTQRCPLLHQSRRSTLTRQDIGASAPNLIEMDRDPGQRPRLQDLWSGKPLITTAASSCPSPCEDRWTVAAM